MRPLVARPYPYVPGALGSPYLVVPLPELVAVTTYVCGDVGLDPDFDPDLRELLDELEQVWRAAGGELSTILAPGVSPAYLDELTAPLGLVLPAEAKTWWGWHNGVTVPAKVRGTDVGGYSAMFLSCEEAVDRYHYQLDWARESMRMDNAPTLRAGGWDPTWFPIFYGSSGWTVAVDCATPSGQPTPIRTPYAEDVMTEDRVVAPSLASVVRMWLKLYRDGDYYFNATTGRWECYELPRWARRAGADGLA